MREANNTDKMKPQDRASRSRGGERKRCDSFVNSLFEEAKDAGVLNASPEDELFPGFWIHTSGGLCSRVVYGRTQPGSGARTGASLAPSLLQEAPRRGEADGVSGELLEEEAEVVIRMWKNGFTINDGELRDYTDAANRQFMDSVRKGELPSELQRTLEKEEVAVNVEDRKSEEYSLKKKQVDPFSGRGYRLGSATPTVINKAVNGIEDAEQSFPTVELNDLEPSTNIKIWLLDGKRIVQKFNTSHRISDVRQFLESMPFKSEKLPFKLATSFPLCDILDETITIQEAHLSNAVLVQRLQKTTEPFRDS